ncbi:recombinase family protein [Enterovibrio calviensis]|uniref:recombinase family protein n=1 Tax=Enterovibrio calviensis TaxID=91359 RepID=UPI0037363E18
MTTTTQYIYARVSTQDQNVQQQVDVLTRDWPTANVFSEKQSGKSLDREQFNAMRDRLKAGDSVLVLSVSRLGRNTLEVLTFIDEMKVLGVAVHVHDLGKLDVTSPTGKIVLTTLAAVAEMQREEILDKQRIGIERAKAEGKYKGKQQTAATVKRCDEALKLISVNGLSKEKAAKAAGVGVATLYRYIKEQQKVAN